MLQSIWMGQLTQEILHGNTYHISVVALQHIAATAAFRANAKVPKALPQPTPLSLKQLPELLLVPTDDAERTLEMPPAILTESMADAVRAMGAF